MNSILAMSTDYLVPATIHGATTASRRTALACKTAPELPIEVTTKFHRLPIPNKYKPSDHVAPAQQQNQLPLGLYTNEHTVERVSAPTTAALTQTGPTLKLIDSPAEKDLNAALCERIRAIVDNVTTLLHSLRQDAQQAVNNANELQHLAHSRSI